MKRIGLLFAMIASLAAPAFAQPAGLVSVDGYWQTSDGTPVFFYNAPWMPSAGILCGLECAGSAIPGGGRWQPISVAEDATLGAPWGRTAIDGASTLTYRNKAVFVWTADVAGVMGKPGFRPWRLAPDVESLAPMPANSPAITRKPEIDFNRSSSPEYPAAARRANEAGYVVLSLCMRQDGGVIWADIARSSGFPRLDDASLRFAFDGFVLTPAMAGDSATAVCGFENTINWTLKQYTPPQPAN